MILFWGLIGTMGVAHSLLLTEGTPWEQTTWFYIVMWISSMIILLFCRFQYGERRQFDYDDRLTEDKLPYVVGGLVATLFLSSILVKAYTRSSIWVPQPHKTLTVGGMSLTAVVNDLFFTFALVANSEETLVLSLSQVVRRKLEQTVQLRRMAFPLSMAVPRAGWAVLHAYVSYTGALMPILVLSAFLSGLVISYCAYNRKTQSFLIAVTIHGLYNSIIIISNALGLV